MINTDNDRLANTLKFKLLAQRQDYAEVEALALEPFLNGVDIAHGGFLFSLCDYASALASNTEERIAISSSASIDFIEAVVPNSEIIAVAQVLTSNQKTGVYQVYITDKQTRSKRFATFHSRVIYKYK